MIKNGHEVEAVETAGEALKWLDHERFDVLISDIELPDISGYELIGEAPRPNSIII